MGWLDKIIKRAPAHTKQSQDSVSGRSPFHPFGRTYPFGTQMNSAFDDVGFHSVVLGAINLVSNTLDKTDFGLVKRYGNDTDTFDFDNDAVQSLNYPLGWSKTELLFSIVDGFFCSGNAILRVGSPLKDIRGVNWRNVRLPRPGFPYYEIFEPMRQIWEQFPIGHPSIIHLRYRRSPDDFNGVGPLHGTVVGEIATDNEAQKYTITMMYNMGVAGLWVMPEAPNQPGANSEDTNEMEKSLNTEYSGNQRGKTIVTESPWKLVELKGAMGRVDMRELRWVPEERILAALNIHPAVMGIGTGSENSQVAATLKTLHEAFYNKCIEPMAEKIGEQLTREYLKLYKTDNRLAIRMDLTRLIWVRRMQTDVDSIRLRMAGEALNRGLVDLIEARQIADIPNAETPSEELLTVRRRQLEASTQTEETEPDDIDEDVE